MPLLAFEVRFSRMTSASDAPSDTLDDTSFAEIQYQGAPVNVLQRYCRDLMNEREKVYFNPLHPGWSFVGYIPTYQPHSREPQSGRRAPLACFFEDGQYRFVLKEAIQPFVPPEDHIEWNVHSSQIWVATVKSIDGQDLGSVALKIIQPSLLPIPKPDEYSFERHLFSRQLAHVERFAYKELRSLQGTIIPFMYGYFKVSNFLFVDGRDILKRPFLGARAKRRDCPHTCS